MNEILFNSLFDRPIHNPDFLRSRVESCVVQISEGVRNNLNVPNYYTKFYLSTVKFNSSLIEHFGLKFLYNTFTELNNFKDFLKNLINLDKNYISKELNKINYTDLITNFKELVNYIGYTNRSKILRRYNNFIKITNNFLHNKILYSAYIKEISNDYDFFNNMLDNFKDSHPSDICIYYLVYDIRASEIIRKLKQKIEKVTCN